MKNEPIVILGGSGFVGKNLTKFLSEHFESVTSVGSKDCDLVSRDAVKSFLASYGENAHIVLCSTIGRLTEDSHTAFQKNVSMAHNVAMEACACNARSLVFLSSADVYGTPPEELPITESTLPSPDTYYGAAKLASETVVKLAIQGKFPAAMLRLPGVFGPQESRDSIVSLFLKKALAGESITLSGGGAVQRDYLFVADLCMIIKALIDEPKDGVFNVATGVSYSLSEFARMAYESVGVDPQIQLDNSHGGRSHDLIFDSSYLRAAFPDLKFTPLKMAMQICLNSF